MPHTPIKKWSLTLKVVIALASLASFVSLAVAGYALIVRFDSTNQARHNNAHVWHEVICSIERITLKNDKLTLEEKRKTIEFYDGLLIQNVHTDPCHFKVRGK